MDYIAHQRNSSIKYLNTCAQKYDYTTNECWWNEKVTISQLKVIVPFISKTRAPFKHKDVFLLKLAQWFWKEISLCREFIFAILFLEKGLRLGWAHKK